MPQILIVDDEPDIRQLLALILESSGHTIMTANNGKEALHHLDHTDIDLVILDIVMPEMDGWEVCRQMKSRSRTKDIPVVILTVRDQPLDRVIGLEVVHADGYVIKPFERDQLLNTLKELLPTVHANRVATD